MKQQDDSKLKIIVLAITTGVVSLILSSMIFSSPDNHNLTALQVAPIKSSFPDVHNDPSYNTFMNQNSLDATQPVQVGNSQNKQPFNQ
jgi:hypothetical protein